VQLVCKIFGITQCLCSHECDCKKEQIKIRAKIEKHAVKKEKTTEKMGL
jgi:hypothetical protein